jgi:hypothetical protein
MNLRLVASLTLACAALALAACDSGRKAPPKVSVRVADVAPGFEQLLFLREQIDRAQMTLQFGSVAEAIYDADTYDFNVHARSLNLNVAGRTWTFRRELDPDHFYTIILAENAGDVVPILLAHSPTDGTNVDVRGVHAASGLPAMDLYVVRSGTGIAGATPRGTFGPLETIPSFILPGGDYEIVLTAAGDPASVLLTSTPVNFPAGGTATIVAMSTGNQGSHPLSVLVIQAASSVHYDRNSGTELRVINAATDQAPRDVVLDGQFSPPLFAAVPFVEPTPYVPVPVGERAVTITPPGNPGVLELDQKYTAVADRRTTLLFAGDAGALRPAFGLDDNRRIHDEAKIRFMNAATQFTAPLDYLVALPGEDPGALQPLSVLAAPGIGSYNFLAPGEYEIYLRLNGSTTIVSGPTRISVVGAGLYSVLAINGPDTATANVRLLDDLP